MLTHPSADRGYEITPDQDRSARCDRVAARQAWQQQQRLLTTWSGLSRGNYGADEKRRSQVPSNLRAQLIGVWKLLSWVETPADGSVQRLPLGPNPSGIIIYHPAGYVSAQLMRADRRAFACGDWSAGARSLRASGPLRRRDSGGAYLRDGQDRGLCRASSGLGSRPIGPSFCMRRAWWETRLFSQPSVLHRSRAGMLSPS
jgi:hypothetical protein